MAPPPTLSIIAVCYNEQDNIRPLYERVIAALTPLGLEPEIIYVDNCSTDGSLAVYRELCGRDPHVKVIRMSRNFATSQTSFLAGLQHCRGAAAVLMDGDLQDPPEVIPQLVAKWREGFEVVYGVRTRRRGSLARRAAYKLFYRLFRKLAYVDVPLDAGDFSLLDRRVIAEILRFGERDLQIRGIRAYVGFRQTGVSYVRDNRQRGATLTSIRSYWKWAQNLVINFSFKPLEWISQLAFAVTALSIIGLVLQIILRFTQPRAPRGIPTIIFALFFFGGVQMLCLAIIGQYLAKIFQEVKRRPRYIIREILNDDQTAATALPDRRDDPPPAAGSRPS